MAMVGEMETGSRSIDRVRPGSGHDDDASVEPVDQFQGESGVAAGEQRPRLTGGFAKPAAVGGRAGAKPNHEPIKKPRQGSGARKIRKIKTISAMKPLQTIKSSP
jgi:hypothetical protein